MTGSSSEQGGPTLEEQGCGRSLLCLLPPPCYSGYRSVIGKATKPIDRPNFQSSNRSMLVSNSLHSLGHNSNLIISADSSTPPATRATSLINTAQMRTASAFSHTSQHTTILPPPHNGSYYSRLSFGSSSSSAPWPQQQVIFSASNQYHRIDTRYQ
jgi:hypothetical protein